MVIDNLLIIHLLQQMQQKKY